jgi:hypothetical protein
VLGKAGIILHAVPAIKKNNDVLLLDWFEGKFTGKPHI